MKRRTLNVLMMLLLLVFVLSGSSLAEEHQAYAAQGNVAFFKENGKIGLQSTDGTVLHAAEFDGAGYFDATQQANIYVDGKIGRIDRSGQIIVEPFACDEIEAIPTNCISESVPPYVLLVSWYGTDDEKVMQLMDVAGNWLSDTKFNLMMYEFINGKLFIKAGELYNQIDAFGQLTSEEWWNYLFVDSSCAEAALPLNKEILDFTGEGILWKRIIRQPNEKEETYLIQGEKSYLAPETWTQFKWLSDQLVAYCENDLWGIADYACNIVMPAQWLFAPDKVNIEEDIWLVVDPSTEEWKWIHSSGETVLSIASGESIDILNENRYIIDDNEVSRLIDNKGNTIAEIDSHYFITWFEGYEYFRFKNYYDDTWGFISLDGEILSEFPITLHEYHDGYTELTNGWFCVIDDERYEDDDAGQCGFVSANGDILLSAEWDAVYDFTANMLARVEVDGQYGFVDTTGAYVIEPQWEYADDFVDAGGQWIAAVYKYSESEVIWKGFINEANELIGEISY